MPRPEPAPTETPPPTESNDRNHGPRPLDAILTEPGIDNHELVAASTEQLTHKQVQKGLKGRQLTSNLQRKVANALNALSGDRKFGVDEWFNYRG